MFKVSFRLLCPRLYSSNTTSVIAQKPILYGDEASPPVRFVLMTASALGIELDYHEIDLFAAKNKTEFYKKINRLQKVPALEIQDQVICDSHVISKYLCEQSRDKVLYPSTTSIRIRIDEMLFFNSGTLFPIDSEIFTDYFAGKWPVNRDKLNILYTALDHLEFNLNNKVWLTGDEMNLSDICLMSTVTSIFQIVPMLNKHKNINEWLLKFETKPFYEINKRGLQRLVKFMNKFKN